MLSSLDWLPESQLVLHQMRGTSDHGQQLQGYAADGNEKDGMRGSFKNYRVISGVISPAQDNCERQCVHCPVPKKIKK